MGSPSHDPNEVTEEIPVQTFAPVAARRMAMPFDEDSDHGKDSGNESQVESDSETDEKSKLSFMQSVYVGSNVSIEFYLYQSV